MSAARTRAVLTDALGTLVALAPPAPRLAEALRREHGIEVTPAQAERAFAREIAYYREHHLEACDECSLADLRRRCAGLLASELPDGVRSLDEAQIVELLLESLHFSAYADAAPALAALREQGLRAIVVSNWDCSLPAVLDRLGLRVLLDGVVTSAELGACKPDARIFGAALDLARAEPSAAVHVGDSVAEDVRGALEAGIRAVFLRRAQAPGLASATPDGSVRAAFGEPSPTQPPSGVPVIETLEDLPSAIHVLGG